MPVGPGKYDLLCTYVREKAGATAAAVVVIKPGDGAGFSVQCPREISPMLVNVFRHVADQIEKELGGEPHEPPITN
ncbi:hypothetical protein LCGC14_1184770 [marine sediment metagenome]|uniref:Uncharacterized protein n=1 Tax=marine sediment metagenome TaxID=412755 RepID=A0A0F9M8X7_9ZZZZ